MNTFLSSHLEKILPPKGYAPPRRLLVTLIGGVVAAEIIAMIVVYYVKPSNYVINTLLDATIMAVLIYPFLYFLSFRPLLVQIAERRQSEEDLKKTNELLERLFSMTHILIAYMDPQFNFIRVNRTYAQVDGRQPEFFVGKNHFELYPHEENQAIFRHVVESGEAYIVHEKPFTYPEHPEWGVTYWDWSLIPVKDDMSRVVALLLTLVDKTGHVRDQQALHQTQRDYKELVNSIDGIVWEADGQTLEFSFVSQQAERLLGYPVERWTQEADFWKKHIYPEDVTWAVDFCMQATKERRDHEFAFRMIAADGGTVWLRDIVHVMEVGDQVKLRGIMVDLTDYKRFEEQIRLQTTAMNAAANGMMITDRSGVIEWANTALTQMTGYRLEEMIGQTPSLFNSGQHPPEFYQQMWETILNGQVWRGELVNRRKDGSLYTEEQTITPVLDRHGVAAHYIAVKQDISERKEAESALEESRQRLYSLFEQLPAVIFLHAPDYSIRFANAEFRRRFGNPYDRFCYEVIHGNQSPCEYCPTFDVYKTQTPVEWEWTTKQGVSYQVIDYPFTDIDGSALVLELATDVTQRKRVEEEIKRLFEAEQRARQTAEILRQASQALSQTLELETVLQNLLEYLGQLVPYDSASVILREDENHLKVRAGRGYERWTDPELLSAITFDAQTNANFKRLLTEQKSLLIEDTSLDPSWEATPTSAHIRNCLQVPLTAEGNVIGVCSLDKTVPGFFTPSHVQLAEALVGQAAVAIQNAWLFEQVRAGRERLQSLSRRLVEVQEGERSYIARELHDEAGQALTSLMVGLRLLERDAGRTEVVQSGVAELKSMVDGVLENLHRLAMDLRPASLSHLGLVPALRQHIEALSDKHALAVQFETVGLESRLPPEMEVNLYRIIQEALTNVVRHAGATRVDVLLEERGEKLIAIVEDNGAGFDPQVIMSGNHLGLFGMRERAEMLGGTLTVETSPGGGSAVFVEVPYAH